MTKEESARFYFANLAADVTRMAKAVEEGNTKRYDELLKHARATLAHLRTTNRHEAYEEGLLMLRAVPLSEKSDLPRLRSYLDTLVASFTLVPGL